MDDLRAPVSRSLGSDRDTQTIFTPEQCEAVLALLQKGASPALVCQELGLSTDAFWNTIHADAGFQAAVQQVFDTLSHNVVTALYQAAIKGNVTAQQFWLRQHPASLFNPVESTDASDDLSELSPDELQAELGETASVLAIACDAEKAARPEPS
jgi:hypothetical protein